MFKTPITYTDFLDRQHTEVVRLHLSQTELQKLIAGGDSFSDRVKRMTTEKDEAALMGLVTEIIDMAYGVLTEDGKSFVKRPEDLERFKGSPIYDELINTIFATPQSAAEFFKAVVPAKIAQQMPSTPEIVAEVQKEENNLVEKPFK